MAPSTLQPSLRDELLSRIRANLPLKVYGVPVFIAVFFAGYFLMLRFPVFPVTPMPVTALDGMIPFQPATLGLYFSLWIYVSIPPGLIRGRGELLEHGKLAATMGLVGLAIFFFWPTSVPARTGLTEAETAGYAWLKNIDAAGNACPSLHVAFAVFSGLWLDRILKGMRFPPVARILNVCWGAGIVYSTLTTKQHVVIDVIAGAALGLVAGSIKPRAGAAGA